MPKEQAGLEGRYVDVGDLKIHIRNAIAEGGFSCVYLARDAVHSSKQYALKHIICNDEESLDLVMKEISVMKSLKGHPNIVALFAHTVLDMGRTKEALLVMEYCEKSLVNVLESRGAGYFEEKQVLLIFRDVCNAVFAMHCQSPPIAHRDLKAENLLLGSDGLWKLCDFGSTSTNHKRFEKPEEMGIEEDNIRKHTTPAYRAPEMWDLFRRELINEKVDIWALGCLLFRICYFKSAFDGESKLQVLNGNYRIPELPKYSSFIVDLIRDMLQASPDARPDITQVWFRVNEQLPVELQKSLPDTPPEQAASEIREGISKSANKSPPMPRRSPPPPPTSLSSKPGGGGQLGAFWSTQHAKDSLVEENRRPNFDEEPPSRGLLKHDPSPSKGEFLQNNTVRKNLHGKSESKFDECVPKDFEVRFFQEDAEHGTERSKVSKSENATVFQNEAFNTFVAEFDNTKLTSGIDSKATNEGDLQSEVERLKEQLKQANIEKAEVTSKYEKLSAICRSQRQEIQELKQAITARSAAGNTDALKNQASADVLSSVNPPRREKMEGTGWERQQVIFDKSSSSPDSKPWQAFAEDPKPRALLKNANIAAIAATTTTTTAMKSVRTRNSHQNRQPAAEVTSGSDTWGFGTDSFTAVTSSGSRMTSRSNIGEGNSSKRFGNSKNLESKSTSSQPAGWAGF